MARKVMRSISCGPVLVLLSLQYDWTPNLRSSAGRIDLAWWVPGVFEGRQGPEGLGAAAGLVGVRVGLSSVF